MFRKLFWALVVLINVLGGALIYSYIHSDVVNNERLSCQYPVRPLVHGKCDNSDPCDPENIKSGGYCDDYMKMPKYKQMKGLGK